MLFSYTPKKSDDFFYDSMLIIFPSCDSDYKPKNTSSEIYDLLVNPLKQDRIPHPSLFSDSLKSVKIMKFLINLLSISIIE
jgi:hypothetical protein